jgi:hypothetical protein
VLIDASGSTPLPWVRSSGFLSSPLAHCADPAVVVEIEQLERVGVELEPLRRAAQRDPELRIELGKILKVSARVEANLIEAACAEETPLMGHVRPRISGVADPTHD